MNKYNETIYNKNVDMKGGINNLCHYGDILAIPFFAILVYYFYGIENKTLLEYILLLFSASGFLLDILYTYIFFSIRRRHK